MDSSSFQERLADRLRSSEYKGPRFKDNGQSMSNLICPACGDQTAWAYSKAPWSINCNRLNKCGARTKTLDLFPDLTLNIEKEFSYTSEDPNRPATAYLDRRGLYDSLKGLNYRYMANLRGTAGGGVMFPIGKDAKGRTIYNGRLFNPPPGEGKTHNIGSTAGLIWRHPGIEYDPGKETYVTEGIIDALSLIELGHQAIAILSAGQDPTNVDLSEFGKLVFSFDYDEAGKKGLKKWTALYPDAKRACPLRGDWNDLLTSLPKENAKKFFMEKRTEFEAKAEMALAETAYDYATIFEKCYGRAAGLFDFERCLYFSYYKATQNGPVLRTERVSNFTLEVRHYQLETSNAEEPVNRFFLDIFPRRGQPVACSVTAQELATPHGLTTMFLQRARALWQGERPASLALASMIVEAGAPVVRQLQISGYERESDCYVFKHFLINHKGGLVTPNKHGFFYVSRALSIRPAPHPTLNPTKGLASAEIWRLIHRAWGDKGVTALAWEVAGWWVNQIKARIGFFPFLSFWGDPQTGKTRLTRILNAIQTLAEEGLPLTRVNTQKGEIRKLAQRSGLFKALLEANNAEKARFDIDSILTLYNENPLQTTALKTIDIQTRDVPFLASIMFVQNKEPFKTKAQKERIISVHFKKEDITDETHAAFNKLLQIPLSDLAYFFVDVMYHRNQIESDWHDEFERARKELYETIPDNRLNENHALILAFHRLLCRIISLEHDLKPYIKEIGQKRFDECNKNCETIADHFFNILLGFENDESDKDSCLKINEGSNHILIHLGKALKKMDEKGYRFYAQIKDLQNSLREHASFLDSNVGRQLGGSYQKVWIFDLQKIVGQA